MLLQLQENIAFASVHDSFWTHAGDVDRMNSILRNKFIELHSGQNIIQQDDSLFKNYSELIPSSRFPVLWSLRQEMINKYGKNIVPRLGYAKHLRNQKVFKNNSLFRKEDWRPVHIPQLPPELLGNQNDTSSDFDLRQVCNSTYFFH